MHIKSAISPTRPLLRRAGCRYWGTTTMRIARLLCWLLLLAGVMAYRPDSAAAQGSVDARQACTPDAIRLCADVIPDVAKVTACMKAKSAQLSEPCRVAMRGGGEHGHKVSRHRAPSHHYRRRHHCYHCG